MNASGLAPRSNFTFVHCNFQSIEAKPQNTTQDISREFVALAFSWGPKHATYDKLLTAKIQDLRFAISWPKIIQISSKTSRWKACFMEIMEIWSPSVAFASFGQ